MYNCLFCFVHNAPKAPAAAALLNDLKADGLTHGDVVIRREQPMKILEENLKDSNGNFLDVVNEPHVVFASPIDDVAANMQLVRETAAVCNFLFEHTVWDVRLLSKSSLLPKIADLINPEHAQRVIYGVSTGTANNALAASFERGTALVSKRIASIHELQDRGLRTYGMICPSLPQIDYNAFVQEMAELLRVGYMEHWWAEVINVRGAAFTATAAGLRAAGFGAEALRLEAISGPGKSDAWEDYARATFEAHARVIPASKLRYLQYVKPKTVEYWRAQRAKGAVLLGVAATETT